MSLSFWKISWLLWHWALAPATVPTVEQPVNFCEVYGVAFQDPNPHRATYRVYVEEDEYSADLIVFKETNRLMADRAGLWFFTPNPAFADFSVCFVEHPNQANFKIYFTDIDAEARCNR